VLFTPFASFVVALSSVRTRRSAASLAIFGVIVMLLATLLVGLGLANKSTPYVATYAYINTSVAFSGPTNFQSFVMDLVLHVDHITVVALLVVEACALGALGWHQVMGRNEPGPARFNALVSAMLFGSAGVLLSWDLAELLAFWGIAGVMTYLLLAQRWGSDDSARRARVVLALPFLTDLSLLCGVAWLYARYGVQHIDTLLPILHTTTGWTVRALVVGSVLLFIGLAGRLALWPVHSWITHTVVSSPAAASAMAQSIWSVLAIVVLYRVMPIFAASNLQTLRACMYMCAVAAVVAPLLALLGNEPRRVVALLGSGAAAAGAAIVIHGFEDPKFTFAVAGVACVLAAAPARVAGTLAVSAIARAMRTDDLGEMGDAWRRMRRSSGALLVAMLVLGLSASGALAFAVGSRSWLGVALGEAVLLISLGALRVFLSAAFGPLRRRRAFDPDRVAEVASGSRGWLYGLALAGAAMLAASMIKGALDFMDGHKHPAPSGAALALWVGVALVGFAASAFAYLRDKDGALRASTISGAWLRRMAATSAAAVDRFLVAPITDLARRIDVGLPSADGALGRFAGETGRLAIAGGRAPALVVVILVAVMLTVLIGLLAPGVLR
jgi:NADH:ubiquinone oxidoreductase subunit 5 (subunit L)/multisubunit Na+/H+ antiporter MnhA subunit